MKNRLAIAGTLCALISLIFAAGAAADSARSAIGVCAQLILPSLFPFFVLSILLNKLGLPAKLGRRLEKIAQKLFGVSGSGMTALLIGLTGGYPLGAGYIADMLENGSIGRGEGERLLAFCNNSGPAFLIGAVGVGVFHSAQIGLFLYAVHAAAAVLAGLLLRKKQDAFPKNEAAPSDLPFSVAFPQAVRQAVSSVLAVCGFVVCFTVLIALLDVRGHFSLLATHLAAAGHMELQTARALLTGFWEIGSAVGAMQGLSPSPLNLCVSAAILGWGGLSVHFQTAAVLCDAELSMKKHLLGRLLSAGLSAALCLAACRLVL